MEEKMKAGIWGFVVGDALGVPVEFLDRSVLKKRPLSEMIGYGSHKVPAGTWSDDSSLMIAALDSIKEIGDIDYDDIMYKFSEWFDYAKYTATDELFDIGIATRKAISNYKYGEVATNCGVKGINENGNGSLMRILPFVYYSYVNELNYDEDIKLINEASSLTHAHEISKLGCKIYSDYVKQLLSGIDKKEALNKLKENNYSRNYSSDSLKYYNRILSGDIIKLDESQIRSSGFVVDTLEACIWCTINSNDYEEAVKKAVNLGNDTDTVGAITGSINGIIYGRDNIPKRWLDKLRKKDYLEELFDEYFNVLINGKSNNQKR